MLLNTGQYDYNSQEIIDKSSELSSVEKTILLLLTRLRYGEANRYRWIISSLDRILEQPEYRKWFIKPFKCYIENIDKYIDYSLVIILWIVRRWFTQEEMHESSLASDLKSVYPTNNGVVDYLIRDILDLPSERTYKEYKHSYDGGDDKINYFIDILKDSDNRIAQLGIRGLDIGKVAKNYFSEITDKETRENLQDIIYNRSYSVLVLNVYFYDILMKHISREVEEFLNGYAKHPLLNMIEEEVNEILLDDIDYIIASCNSVVPRPSEILRPEEIDNSITNVELGEWISLGYYERWYNKRERHKDNYGENMDSTIIMSGIGFTDSDDVVPFNRFRNDYRLYDENYTNGHVESIKQNPFIIVSNLKIHEDIYLSYRPYDYLGVRADILAVLGIEIIEKGEGIVGIDDTGDVVLKYFKWEECFDDVDCGSYRIPYLVGAEIKVKKQVFNTICQFYDVTPKRHTIKFQ